LLPFSISPFLSLSFPSLFLTFFPASLFLPLVHQGTLHIFYRWSGLNSFPAASRNLSSQINSWKHSKGKKKVKLSLRFN
jgi:hypothetical protein